MYKEAIVLMVCGLHLFDRGVVCEHGYSRFCFVAKSIEVLASEILFDLVGLTDLA